MTATADVQALLDTLEGLHAPPPIPWWPLAWGWWVAALACFAALWWAARWGLERYRRRQWRSLVRARLIEIERSVATTPADQLMAELSVLLRQIALVQLPRVAVARLHGKPWLEQLDRLGGTNQFSVGPGRLLVDAPYRSVSVGRPELEAVIGLTWRLLKRARDPGLRHAAALSPAGGQRD